MAKREAIEFRALISNRGDVLRGRRCGSRDHLTPEITRAERITYKMSARKEHEREALEASRLNELLGVAIPG